jgi:3-oxoacyl-[acyl-carrier-protein] synthase-3
VTAKSFIRSTGAFAPPRVVTNAEMAKIVDTSDEWIFKRTGIRSRHLVEKEGAMSTVDMAKKASVKALEMAGLEPNDLDAIICGTVTPDYRLPSAACVLQHRLKAKNAFAFDVIAACAGSLYALNIADRFIASGQCKRILVIGAETMSTITNWSDRNSCVLFGDAGSAAIIEKSHEHKHGFLDFILRSDGDYWKTISIPEGGSRTPLTPVSLAQKADRVIMNGRETYKVAVKALTEIAKDILNRNGLKSENVIHVVAHQANLRILEAVAERLHIPMDRFVLNIERYANTSAASLLTTYDEALRSGRFQKGDMILMMAIGAGLAWGAALYRV